MKFPRPTVLAVLALSILFAIGGCGGDLTLTPEPGTNPTAIPRTNLQSVQQSTYPAITSSDWAAQTEAVNSGQLQGSYDTDWGENVALVLTPPAQYDATRAKERKLMPEMHSLSERQHIVWKQEEAAGIKWPNESEEGKYLHARGQVLEYEFKHDIVPQAERELTAQGGDNKGGMR